MELSYWLKIKPIFGGRDPFLNNNGGSSNDNDETTEGQEPIGNARELASSSQEWENGKSDYDE